MAAGGQHRDLLCGSENTKVWNGSSANIWRRDCSQVVIFMSDAAVYGEPE